MMGELGTRRATHQDRGHDVHVDHLAELAHIGLFERDCIEQIHTGVLSFVMTHNRPR